MCNCRSSAPCAECLGLVPPRPPFADVIERLDKMPLEELEAMTDSEFADFVFAGDLESLGDV